MTEKSESEYPNIHLAGTDTDLPRNFTNDFVKYTGFQKMEAGGGGLLMSCFDNNLRRRVCIKRLLPNSENFERDRRRLLREARITAQLQHPNTVPVYEIGKDDEGALYFAMKKIEGWNLYRILGRIAQGDEDAVRDFNLDRILGILIQASNALAYAHAHGVIHRDIKPENIMVGLFGEVALMDWGVAKVWGMPENEEEEAEVRQELQERLTGTGQRPGTPLYMSPEQVNNKPHIDERTDIFSMGVVLYEALTFKEPFRGQSVKDTFMYIKHDTPKPPSEVVEGRVISQRLDAICAKAMQKDPRDRYQSMQAMIDDIRSYRNDAMESVQSE